MILFLETRNEALQKELKHANELLETSKKRGISALSDEDIEKLSPAAAATSRLLKSGLSLTQVGGIKEIYMVEYGYS